MSTFTLPNSNVTVELVEGLSREQLLEFPAFKVCTLPSDSWFLFKQLQKPNPHTYSGIRIGSQDYKATLRSRNPTPRMSFTSRHSNYDILKFRRSTGLELIVSAS
jgi:hypothetical protein